MSIYPHTVTAWIKGVEDRQATWEGPEILTRVRFDEVFGATPGIQGDTSNRSVTMLMPGSAEPLKKGDRVIMGAHAEEKPPQDAFTVETSSPIHIGSRIHHWELTLT